jgi:hypothetical protein
MKTSTIDTVLAIDVAHRYPGVTDGLVSLVDLTRKSWDFSCPTLEASLQSTFAETRVSSLKEYTDSFYALYPILESVPLNGLLIAGGAAGQFVLQSKRQCLWKATDVDVFVYGQKTTAEALARIEKFIIDLERAALQLRLAEYLKLLRTRCADLQREEAKISPDSVHLACAKGQLLLAIRTLQKFLSYPPAIKLDGWEVVRPEWASDAEWDAVLAKIGPMSLGIPSVSGAIRSEGSLTVLFPDGGLPKIQFIFRLYASVSEILHGFDLGASAVGFDGKNVWFTALGKFAYEYGLSIVDVTRRSPSYEARLLKYMQRGFRLAAPGLDMAALSKSPCVKFGLPGVLDLPYMPLKFENVYTNRVIISGPMLIRDSQSGSATAEAQSDYGPDGEFLENEDGCAEYKASYANLRRLLQGRRDFIYIVEDGAPLSRVVDTFTKPPHLSSDMINYLYDRFRRATWVGGHLNVRCLHAYVPLADLGKLVQLAVGGPGPMQDELDRLFNAQKAAAIKAWTELEGTTSAVKWITENPGKQGGLLTGSRSPVVTTTAEWYGPHYKAVVLTGST